MSLPSLHQSSTQSVRFSVSSLLVIQSTITLSAMGAIGSTQPGWIGAQQASAQDAPVTVPAPNSVSTSATRLSPFSIQLDCNFMAPFPIPNCQPVLPPSVGASLPKKPDPGLLRDAERDINQSVHLERRAPESDSQELRIVIPVF